MSLELCHRRFWVSKSWMSFLYLFIFFKWLVILIWLIIKLAFGNHCHSDLLEKVGHDSAFEVNLDPVSRPAKGLFCFEDSVRIGNTNNLEIWKALLPLSVDSMAAKGYYAPQGAPISDWGSLASQEGASHDLVHYLDFLGEGSWSRLPQCPPGN